MKTPTELKEKNPHPRDVNITFEEGPHIYTVNGERGTYTSVTTWVHKHFPVFKSDEIINNILSSSKMKDPTYRYYGMTKEQILTQWNTKRDSSASAGTNMHYDIECYYNGWDVSNNSIEFQYFMSFAKQFSHLIPYRTEWMIYHEDLKLSGSVDMVFQRPDDGHLEIYDWKRCQEITYENNFGQSAVTKCISHFPDTNYWHYSLQLNTYKKIIEEKYGKKVMGLYLVCLHPDNYEKTFERIKVPILEDEINILFEERRKYVLENPTVPKPKWNGRKTPSPPIPELDLSKVSAVNETEMVSAPRSAV